MSNASLVDPFCLRILVAPWWSAKAPRFANEQIPTPRTSRTGLVSGRLKISRFGVHWDQHDARSKIERAQRAKFQKFLEKRD
jgi:hypothetical protein